MSRQVMLSWTLAVCCAMLTGCAGDLVALRSDPHNPLAEKLMLSARGGPRPTPRTAQLLRRYDLKRLSLKPQEQLAALTAIHERQPTLETHYALAELSYIAGKKKELHDRREAVAFYWNAVTNAYSYLFDRRFDDVRNSYDPQFRGACDVYNEALESCLRIAQKEGLFHPGRRVAIEVAGRTLVVEIEPSGFQWQAEEFDRFEFVSDYELKRLENKHSTYGLGVPLIAVRKRRADAPAEVERYYADGLSFPVTAFLRLDMEQLNGDGAQTAKLELHDPLQTTTIAAAGRAVPLESDLSTPLAYFLNNPQMRHLDTLGLLRPSQVERAAGLYMVQPYQPAKIPVLMVHGLWSSPMTWMEMFNELQSDPRIRENYQFWFYLYPTGKPFWETAAELRQDLAEVRQVFDPEGLQRELDDMVVVGHSMGGLIGRLVTLESGDRYWQAVSDEPLELVNASDDTKDYFRRVYYFEPESSIRRVVTIGTPHRGSQFANTGIRWIARQLISLPSRTLETAVDVVSRNPKAAGSPSSPLMSTSIDGLAPDSPILQAMQETPEPPVLQHHNIVGVIEDHWYFRDTDGVVPYESAHWESANSEIVVNANHSHVHRHPGSVIELHEILLAHLNEVANEKRRGPVRNADGRAPGVLAP